MHLYTSAAPSHMGSFVCYQYCIQSVNSHQAQASPRMHSAPGTCFIQDTLCTGHMLYTGCTLHQVQTFHRMYCAPDTCFAQDAFCTRCVLCTGYPLHTACALHRVPPAPGTCFMQNALCTWYILYGGYTLGVMCLNLDKFIMTCSYHYFTNRLFSLHWKASETFSCLFSFASFRMLS